MREYFLDQIILIVNIIEDWTILDLVQSENSLSECTVLLRYRQELEHKYLLDQINSYQQQFFLYQFQNTLLYICSHPRSIWIAYRYI